MVADVCRISCDLPETRVAKQIVPSPASSLEVALAMVSRDHTPFGSVDAFFKESMRRDAMTGTRIVFALEYTLMPTSVARRPPQHQGKRELTLQEGAESLPVNTRDQHNVTNSPPS